MVDESMRLEAEGIIVLAATKGQFELRTKWLGSGAPLIREINTDDCPLSVAAEVTFDYPRAAKKFEMSNWESAVFISAADGYNGDHIIGEKSLPETVARVAELRTLMLKAFGLEEPCLTNTPSTSPTPTESSPESLSKQETAQKSSAF